MLPTTSTAAGFAFRSQHLRAVQLLTSGIVRLFAQVWHSKINISDPALKFRKQPCSSASKCSWCLYTNNSVALSLKNSDPNLLMVYFVMYIFRDNVRPDRYLTSVTKPHYQIWTSACNCLWILIVNPELESSNVWSCNWVLAQTFQIQGLIRLGTLTSRHVAANSQLWAHLQVAAWRYKKCRQKSKFQICLGLQTALLASIVLFCARSCGGSGCCTTSGFHWCAASQLCSTGTIQTFELSQCCGVERQQINASLKLCNIYCLHNFQHKKQHSHCCAPVNNSCFFARPWRVCEAQLRSASKSLANSSIRQVLQCW